MLKFMLKGQVLQRIDNEKLVQYARNYPQAEFQLGDDWKALDYVVIQFRKKGQTYDVELDENNCCVVPWECLEEKGDIEITAMGGDLITTDTVRIAVYGNGLVGGIVSKPPTPTVWQQMKDMGKDIDKLKEDVVTLNKKDTFDNIKTGNLYFKEGIFASTSGGEDNRALIELGGKTGIRILNNAVTNNEYSIRIGDSEYENSQITNGIEYTINKKDGRAEFFVLRGNNENDDGDSLAVGDRALIALTDKSGTDNFIKANETFEIIAGNNSHLSFATDRAGIEYTNATWTENLKQLDVTTEKGINMEALNNSYWWVNAEKKAVYGNSLNKLEFRAKDGVAKFSNSVSAKDYFIGKVPIDDKINEIAEMKAKSLLREYIASACGNNQASINYLAGLCSDAYKKLDVGVTANTVTAYIYNDGKCFVAGKGDIKDNAFSSSTDIKNVYITGGITAISGNAFAGCNSLAVINVNKSQNSIAGSPWGAVNAKIVWM